MLATVVFLAAWVSSPHAQTDSDRLSRNWKRVRSENFVAVGDAGERDLRAALKELEMFRYALLQLFPGLRLDAPVPVVLVVFGSQDEMVRFNPRDENGRRNRNVAGYFARNPDTIYMVVGSQRNRDDTNAVLFHEYTHFIVHRALRNVPAWANEGLAEFYGSYRTGATGIIGNIPPWRRSALRNEPLLTMDRLFTPAGVAKTFRNPFDMNRFYAASWALVHYLILGDRRGQLMPYLKAVQNGASMEEAFTATFKVSFEQMRVELQTYLSKPGLSGVGLPIPPELERANPAAEPMLESDALQLQADLLLRNGWPEDAAPLLKRALALDPTHRAARATSARVALLERDHDRAVRELQAVAAVAPDDFAVHYWLGTALADAGRAQEAVAAATRATELNGRSPEAWVQLSTTTLGAGREAQSNAALNLAVQLEDDPQWYFTRAHEAFETGHYEVITKDVSAYINGAGLERADYMTFLGTLAHRRLNQHEEADRLLATLAPLLADDTWQAAVTRFLRGQGKPDELLNRARNNGERTEAHGYVGLMASIAGDRATALEHLHWVRDRGEKNYTEYRLSLAELARLEAAPATAGEPSVGDASSGR